MLQERKSKIKSRHCCSVLMCSENQECFDGKSFILVGNKIWENNSHSFTTFKIKAQDVQLLV